MSGMTRDEIVEVTGYPADLVVRICSAAYSDVERLA
jgi:hypothetical protein